jgi:hypothetical protein
MRRDMLDATASSGDDSRLVKLDEAKQRRLTMRSGILLTAAFVAMTYIAMPATSAQAEEWCGFSARPGAIVQCGYSSFDSCENLIGKGAMCFVNPYVALNTRRPTPTKRAALTANEG